MKRPAEEAGVLSQFFCFALTWDDRKNRAPQTMGAAGENHGAHRRRYDRSPLEEGYEVATEAIENGAERGRHDGRVPRACRATTCRAKGRALLGTC